MALIEIHADLARVAKALERLADAAERAHPAPQARRPVKKVEVGDVTWIRDEDLEKARVEKAARQALGIHDE